MKKYMPYIVFSLLCASIDTILASSRIQSSKFTKYDSKTSGEASDYESDLEEPIDAQSNDDDSEVTSCKLRMSVVPSVQLNSWLQEPNSTEKQHRDTNKQAHISCENSPRLADDFSRASSPVRESRED